MQVDLTQQLPPGVQIVISRTYPGAPYFFNTFTGEASWTAPPSHKRGRENGDDGDRLAKKAANAARVAIIVPYRDLHPEQKRASHLNKFIERMTPFMQKAGVEFHIYIIEQSDDGRKFNRGKLLNIGFDRAMQEQYNTFIFHDVDLIPSDDLLPWYSKIPRNPIHIARRWFGRYANNDSYFGGIVSVNKEQFELMNGYPNSFWGWGGEDDELFKRIQKVGLQIEYPDRGSIVDLEEMNLDQKLAHLKEHSDWKCMVKREVLAEHEQTWRENGLKNLDYMEQADEQRTPHVTIVKVDVKLNNHWSDTKTTWDGP